MYDFDTGFISIIREYYFIHRYGNCKAKMKVRLQLQYLSGLLQCFCTAKKNFKTTIHHQQICDVTFNSLSLTSKLSLSRLVQIQFNFSSSNTQFCPIRNLITNFTCGLIHLLVNLAEFRQVQSIKLFSFFLKESSCIWKMIETLLILINYTLISSAIYFIRVSQQMFNYS